jgi:hypothetical protein
MTLSVHPWLDVISQADISQVSRETYIRNAGRVVALSNASLEQVIAYPKHVLKLIREKYPNAQSSKAMIASVKAIFKYNPDVKERFADAFEIWHEASKSLDKSITDRTATAEPTPRELRNWVPWTKIMEKQRELAQQSYGSTDHLALSMYTLIEPARADYGNVEIFAYVPDSDEAPASHMVLRKSGSYLILTDYKTSKKYGVHRRDLPDELTSVITTNLRRYPRDHLFVDVSGNPYIKNSFTKYINRVLERLFGCRITVSLLRHSFISSLDFNEKTPGELFQHSRHMMHSIGQQQLYRRKIPERKIVVLPEPQRTQTREIQYPSIAAPPPPPVVKKTRKKKKARETAEQPAGDDSDRYVYI